MLLAPVRSGLKQRQILTRQIARRRVRRQGNGLLPIPPGATTVAPALAQNATFQQDVRILWLSGECTVDIVLGQLQVP